MPSAKLQFKPDRSFSEVSYNNQLPFDEKKSDKRFFLIKAGLNRNFAEVKQVFWKGDQKWLRKKMC